MLSVTATRERATRDRAAARELGQSGSGASWAAGLSGVRKWAAGLVLNWAAERGSSWARVEVGWASWAELFLGLGWVAIWILGWLGWVWFF